MSLFTRILMFYMIFTIGEYALGITTPASLLLSGNGYNNFISIFGTAAGNSFWLMLGLTAVAGIVAGVGLAGGGSIGFVMPILLFAPFAAFFLTILTFPTTLLNSTGIPKEVVDFFTLFYNALNILTIYALISWIKGNE